jgi:YVTN family beta-propeller protein
VGDRYRARTLEVGECPHDPLLSASGREVFVPCAGSGEIVTVRLADACIAGRCTVGDGPSHLALHPDGTRIYSANSWDGSITCVTAEGARVAQAASGGWAHAIAITPDGSWVYVANFFDGSLAVFDAATLERVALLETDAYPHGLDISPDGRFALASCYGSEHVRVIDARSHRTLARIAVGWGPSHAAFADGCAYIGCSVADHVACVDLASLQLKGQTAIH